MTAAAFRPSPAVRASISADGLVLLDVRGGVVLASNTVGARIWQLLENGATVAGAAGKLVEEYGIAHERANGDVAAFVATLVARGLVTREPSC